MKINPMPIAIARLPTRRILRSLGGRTRIVHVVPAMPAPSIDYRCYESPSRERINARSLEAFFFMCGSKSK